MASFTLLGFLVQWPTLFTLARFPLLAGMCARLARMGEREVRDQFEPKFTTYAGQVFSSRP